MEKPGDDIVKMKRLIVLLVLMAFIFTSIGILFAKELQNVPYWWKGRNFTGRIIRIAKNRIIVVNRKNQRKEFKIDSQTRIFLRKSEKMEPGLFVKVIYKETKQINIARAIREVKKAP